VGDVLVSRPFFPKRRPFTASGLCIGLGQGDGLADAGSASPRLVLPVDQVAMQMEDIRDVLPIILNPA
jgi:hypothetical protein